MSNLQIFDITGIFLLALIIGGMFFFAAIMTPLVFTKLPPEISGPFIRETFPVYSQAMAGMTFAAVIFLWSFPASGYLISVVIIFLMLVPFIGIEIKGSKRWLDLFFLPRFQPVELVKPLFIMFIAKIIILNNKSNI